MIARIAFLVAAATAASSGWAQNYTPAPAKIEGEIARSDPLDAQQRRYDEYAVELERGQEIVVAASAVPGSNLDPMIGVYLAGAEDPFAGDDDSGSGLNARLSINAPISGLYRIRIFAYGGTVGPYALELKSLGIRAGAAPRRNFAPRARAPEPAAGAAPPAEEAAPLSRFIICPGHPRCPR